MKKTHTKWPLLVVILAVLTGSVVCAYALVVSLDVYVDFALLDENDDPLADGMTVMVFGSKNPINDGPQTWGGTNVIANSTQGDDILLATLTISTVESGIPGGFFATISYESDDVDFVYIRFFNAPPSALTGMIYWGTSSVIQLGVTLGVSTVNFTPETNLVTDNYNNFVIIPEPSTANLFVMVAGMMWAMRSHMRRKDSGRATSGDA